MHGVNGWQIGDGYENRNEKKLDAHDQKSLYDVLLNEVLNTYYEDKKKWVEMMKQSVITTHQAFAVKRMLAEYYDKLYTE
jgi:starch phosphorylase